MSGSEYAPPSGSAFPPVLDACCGTKAFWFDKADSRAVFHDKRDEECPIKPDAERPAERKRVTKKYSEYFPNRPIWLVFDTSNGHAAGRRYVWWFDSRDDAREHMRQQRERARSAGLAGPVKFVPANAEAHGRAVARTVQPLVGHSGVSE